MLNKKYAFEASGTIKDKTLVIISNSNIGFNNTGIHQRPWPLILDKPLNVYTVQNPRRRVVSIKTSQMHTICTLIGREFCLLVYIFTTALILGW
jgi:hypothetical protein